MASQLLVVLTLAVAPRVAAPAPQMPETTSLFVTHLGRYRDAIDICMRGSQRHPNEPRLYRHRGHRYITIRKFDLGIADLKRGL